MSLHKLKPAPGSRPPKRIVGRGEGSTLGQTAGKGQKGQSSRAGDTIMNGFEGGQTPMIRRIPKRGFNHPSKIYYQAINVRELESRFEAGAEINGAALVEKRLLRSADQPFKVLGDGKLTKKFNVVATQFSKSAEEAVKKAGGSLKVATPAAAAKA